MKKIATGALLAILAMTFVTCVFGYGQNKVFSLRIWLENLSGFGDIGTLQDIVEIWRDDSREHTDELPDGEGDPERSTFFDRVLEFFAEIGTFFKRLWDTIVLIIELAADVFVNLGKLLPWNATVEREVLFGV